MNIEKEFALGTRVRVEKSAEKKPGLVEVGYWLEGVIDEVPRVGQLFWVERTKNCLSAPDVRHGYFNTSEILSINELNENTIELDTRNSTWKVTKIVENCENGLDD